MFTWTSVSDSNRYIYSYAHTYRLANAYSHAYRVPDAYCLRRFVHVCVRCGYASARSYRHW